MPCGLRHAACCMAATPRPISVRALRLHTVATASTPTFEVGIALPHPGWRLLFRVPRRYRFGAIAQCAHAVHVLLALA